VTSPVAGFFTGEMAEDVPANIVFSIQWLMILGT
jgi:hypothetical protein